jgi:cbb3-type cytochrome oxidase maturation protein
MSLEFTTQGLIALVVSLLVFGGAAVWALAWAVRKGQFANFKRAAEAIFDEDEPIGKPTDRVLAPPTDEQDGVVDG